MNHNTVARTWRDLEQMGVAVGRTGRGVFITPEGPAIAREKRLDATLFTLRRALQEALRAGHDPARLEGLLKETNKRKSA